MPRFTASRMPRWAYTLAALLVGASSLAVIVAGRVTWGIVALIAAGLYGIWVRRWDEASSERGARADRRSSLFRWPRYSEHPLLNRVRWAAALIGFIVYAAILVVLTVH